MKTLAVALIVQVVMAALATSLWSYLSSRHGWPEISFLGWLCILFLARIIMPGPPVEY